MFVKKVFTIWQTEYQPGASNEETFHEELCCLMHELQQLVAKFEFNDRVENTLKFVEDVVPPLELLFTDLLKRFEHFYTKIKLHCIDTLVYSWYKLQIL